MGLIQIKEFDFNTGKNKEEKVSEHNDKNGTKFVDPNSEPVWKEVLNKLKDNSKGGQCEQCKNSDHDGLHTCNKKPSAIPMPMPSTKTKVYAPNINTEIKTRTWQSDPDWFDGYMRPARPEEPVFPKRIIKGNQNIMEIQEKAVAEAYAKFLTAKREYLQEKRTLNQLYDTFEVSELKE